MAIKTQVKKWGNSIGIVLPREFVISKNIKENDTIMIDVVKQADFSDVFGTLPKKMSGQQFKDMVRKGW